jgi:O-antigen/teichoic acid export membrane protein
MRTHLYFGLQSAAAAVLLELNAKIDIWMLGLWLTDTKVGFYTWAAMFAEGFWQVLVVLQNQINPVLAQHLAAGNTAAVEALARSMRWKSVALVAGIGVLSLPAYSYIVEQLGGTLGFSESVQAYRILVVGVVCAAAWQPMAQILLMANQPARHSMLMLCTVAVNIAANALLIPSYGLEGAALGTAISVAVGAGFLKYAARRYAGVRI